MPLLPRGLAEPLLTTLSTTKVLLLQGPRASGKTSLLTELREAGHLGSISDFSIPTVRQVFDADPSGFLQALARPAAIDEGQLGDGLLVALKHEVDRRADLNQFVVTGSTRLATGELGGSHPLAGRSVPSLLRPMTQGEREGKPNEIMTHLFDGDPRDLPVAGGGLEDLQRRMISGGLPSMPGVLGTRTSRAASEARAAYVDDVLRPLPGQPAHDHRALVRTFRYLAGQPAQILNKQRAAERLELSRPTFAAYLDRLRSAYLIEEIPALRPGEAASARAHPKIHVPDPGLAAWAAGMQSPGSTAVLGPLVESFVAHELLAQAAWSRLRPVARHWREQNAEVDLVFVDADERTIAVEVKASQSVSNRDLAGVSRLHRRRAVHRGFVFYTGDQVVSLGNDRWAIPISALWGTDAARKPGVTNQRPVNMTPDTPEAKDTRPTSSDESNDAALFLSYVHADNDDEHGRITDIASDIARRFELQTGERLRVFTDDQIQWSEEWSARLSRELMQTTYFVPVVTPRFMRSEACRQEVLEFTAKATALGVSEFVMPILYISPPGFDESNDTVASLIRQAQYVDWQPIVYADRDSGAYRQGIDRLVRRLAAAREAAPVVSSRSDDTLAVSTQDPRDIAEAFEDLERITDVVETHVDSLVEAMDLLSSDLDAYGPRIEQAAASPKRLRAVLREAGQALSKPSHAFGQAAGVLREDIAGLDRTIAEAVAFGARDVHGTFGFRDEINAAILDLPEEVDLQGTDLVELRQMMGLIAGFSRELRPLAASFEEAILVIEDLNGALRRWRASVVSDARDA